MSEPSHRPSTGDMISTLCFLGVGLWLLGNATLEPWPRNALLALAGAASLAGAARHIIARALSRRRETRRRP
ncbi:MAG: hypothetical protein AAGH73_02865 [Pseudomonadota bacterium]